MEWHRAVAVPAAVPATAVGVSRDADSSSTDTFSLITISPAYKKCFEGKIQN